jgi:hypothetical protein
MQLSNERYVDYPFKLADYHEDDVLVLEIIAEVEAVVGSDDKKRLRELRDWRAAALVRQ